MLSLIKIFFQKHTENILKITLAILIFLFSFSLFKNIQYPLLWEDEADTVMFATRIMKYGYPKVYDGKNIINPYYPPNFSLVVNKKLDAYLFHGWLQFYFTAVWTILAKFVENIYLKTAILRIPFASLGLLGILIFVLSVIKNFRKKSQKLAILSLFFTIEILSVSLVLHLREVRYYSLIVFLSACIFYIYIRYKIFNSFKFTTYFISSILLLFLIFNTYYPVYFIFIATIGLYEIFSLISYLKSKNKKSKYLKLVYPFIPLILSFFTILPLVSFFNIINLSADVSKIFGFSISIYYKNIFQMLNFLGKYEFLWLAIFVKIIAFTPPIYHFSYREKTTNIQSEISKFLSLFFIVYILIIAQNPTIVYIRYFIVLQPIIALSSVIDITLIYEYIYNKPKSFIRNKIVTLYPVIIMLFIVIFGVSKIDSISGHIYEMNHQYKGPIDHIVSYIQSNFRNPENLIIATNYEETSYMYYLDSKVTIGYVGNNLKEDIKIQPDIISFRQIPGYVNPNIFNLFLKKEKYKKIIFPIYNYYVNNIPELSGKIVHLFKTKFTTNDNEKLAIFVREELLEKKEQ